MFTNNKNLKGKIQNREEKEVKISSVGAFQIFGEQEFVKKKRLK